MINKAFENGLEKYALRDMEGAVMDFTLALEKDPTNPEILYQRAMAYFHLQKKSLALLDMDQAVEMQPNYSFRYASRAYMRDSFGDVMGAIADYRQAIELDPEDAISYNNLGILEDKMGRRQISQGYFERADKLRESDSNKDWNDMDPPGVTINYHRKEGDQQPLPEVPKKSSVWSEMAKVFTTTKGFKEFMRYVFNGFKIPQNK